MTKVRRIYLLFISRISVFQLSHAVFVDVNLYVFAQICRHPPFVAKYFYVNLSLLCLKTEGP